MRKEHNEQKNRFALAGAAREIGLVQVRLQHALNREDFSEVVSLAHLIANTATFIMAEAQEQDS